MTKQEFMHRLAQQLVSLPPEERLCALKFYDEYFADAGEENWAAVIRDLGSPEEVARTIREDFAQRNPGYDPNGQYAYRPGPQYHPGQGHQTYTTSPETYLRRGYGPQPSVYAPKRSGCGTALIVLLLVLGSPLWFGLLVAALAVVVALAAVLVGLAVAAVVVVIALLAAGVWGVWAAATGFAAAPGARLLGLGTGMLLTGGGLLALLLGGWLAVTILPPVFRWVVELLRKPFHNRKDGGAV